MDNKQTQYLHQVLDKAEESKILSPQDVEALREHLPERPKQKTLTEITHDVYRAWYETLSNHWKERKLGDLETWLNDLHEQLQGLKDTPTSSPALPAGMRLATHEEFGRVVATDWIDSDNEHFCVFRSDKLGYGTYAFLPKESLTFIDTEPAHPEFLETEADYENAPEGTIVACEDSPPCHKFGSEWSSVLFYGMKDDRGMSRACRRVLRWGWGDK